jgi:acetyltransferase-like isoleucine patch superfamily enzyme
MIKIGFGDVGIFDRKSSRTIWENKGQIIFQGRADIGHGSKICVGKNGELLFGKQFVITAESSIICFNKIFFGERCLLSWDTLIMDTDFHKIYFNDKVINQNQQIVIGNKIWIGARSTILKGVAIASNSVVAAGSVVNKTFTDESVLIAGVPARVVKENISWEI